MSARRSAIRWILVAAPCLVLTSAATAQRPSSRAATPQLDPAPGAGQRLAAIEARLGGRLGVAALDTGSGRRIEYHARDRFALCSTFKLLLAAAGLARVAARAESLDRRIGYGPGALLEYAPVTREHVAEGGLSVTDLCAAAIEQSDNTAANLLLVSIGGPQDLTRFVRGLGDGDTRLDRTEPELNENAAGDLRDTTTPAAMAGNVRRLLLGDALSEGSRERLCAWLLASKTGAARLRAGLPATWRVGNKSGSGANGATNDVAIAWPPGRPPIVVAAYLNASAAPPGLREAALAEVSGVVATGF